MASFVINEMQMKTTVNARMKVAKIKCQTESYAGEQSKAAHTTGWNVNRYKPLVKRFGSSNEVKHTLTLGPSNCTPTYLPKRNENIHLGCLAQECLYQLYLQEPKPIDNSNAHEHWHSINKCWYIIALDNSSTVKRNEFLLHSIT